MMKDIHAHNVTDCPFMVSLKQKSDSQLRYCGGSVLTTTLTLTAAHCLIFGLKDLTLTFGSVHLFKDGIQHQATQIITHQLFNLKTMANDIGTVSIYPSSVVFSRNIQPVVLPIFEKFNENGFVTIYGWGKASEKTSFSLALRQASLPVVSRKLCEKLLKSRLPEYTFCAGYPDGHIDACTGDSGGPAMLEGIQVGITSFGEGCAVPLKPGVYTDVTKYLHWLKRLRI